jgi:geranylgeranyl pyrophosphate synthase
MRDRIEAMMRAVLAPGPLCTLVEEHLGAGGKRLRGRLAADAVLALGGTDDEAIAWGAACELFHNGTLIHDDIQDGDRVRRKHPTVWARHGVPQAINAGDLLFVAPFALLVGRLAKLAPLLATVAMETIQGQALELLLNASQDFDRTRYLAAAAAKTSGLFRLPVAGALQLMGVADEPACTAFADLGVAFQLQDDVIDLYGDKGRGAPGRDLVEGKVSALLVEHAAAFPRDVSWLRDLLGKGQTLAAEDVAAAALRLAGARATVEAQIARRTARALRGPLAALYGGLAAALRG